MDSNPAAEATTEAAPEAVSSFTQQEVDRIVADRLKREREKFADYADLKAKAEGAKSLEQQFAELRAENARVTRDALASRVASQFGISAEDADLFLTGSDMESITAQAKRLVARDQERKAKGNVVPTEGRTPTNTADPLREITRQIFGNKS